MIDLAELQLVVDAGQVVAAAEALDTLRLAGARAEAGVKGLATAVERGAASTKKQADASREAGEGARTQAAHEEYLHQVKLRTAVLTEKSNLRDFEAIRKRDEARGSTQATSERIYRQLFDEIAAKEKLAATEARLLAVRTQQFKSGIQDQRLKEIASAEELSRVHAYALVKNEEFNRSVERSALAASRKRGAIRQLSHEMRSFALDITGAAFLVAGFTAALTAPAALGVKLQSILENTRLGMAAILVSMTRVNGEATTLPKALEVSGGIMKQLVADSLKYGVSISTLAETMRSVLAPGLAAGLNLKQIQEIATFGTIAVKTIGLDSKQTVQEVRDLVAGGITAASSTLARSLSISDSDVKRWREAGTLYTELFTRMRGFAATAEESTKTLTGAWTVLQTKMALLFTSESGFTGVKDTLLAISNYIGEVDKKTGEMRFNPDLLAETKRYWGMLTGVLETLRGIGSVLVYHVELDFTKNENSWRDLAEQVKKLGFAIADGIKDGIRRGVTGATAELPAPIGLGLGTVAPPDVDRLRRMASGNDVDWSSRLGAPPDEITGPLPSLSDREKEWKQAIGTTIQGLTMEYEEKLKAFERDRKLLAEHKRAKGADMADLAQKEKTFNQARIDEEKRYLNAVMGLIDEGSRARTEADRVSIEAQKIYWASVRANEAETLSIEKKTRAIELQTIRLEESKSQALLASATGHIGEALAIEAIPMASHSELGKARALRGQAGAEVNLAGVEQTNEQMDLLIKRAREASEAWANSAQNVRASLVDAFGEGGKALSGFFGAYADGESQLARIEEKRLQRSKDDPAKATEYAKQAANETALATVNSYASMAGAAKGFFKEGTDGYRNMVAVERSLRAVQFAMSVASMVQNIAEGASRMFAVLGPFAWPVIGAMVATLAAFGASSRGGGGSAPAVETRKPGTGTVLGEPDSVSNSIADSLEILAKNSQPMLGYTREMSESLNAVKYNLSGLGRAVTRPPAVGGTDFNIPGLGGQGLSFEGQTVGQAVGGVKGATYQSVFVPEQSNIIQEGNGLSGEDFIPEITQIIPAHYEDVLTALDTDITGWLTKTVASLRETVLTGANALGIEGAGAVIDNLALGLSQLNFEGLSAEEIEKAIVGELNVAFDNMVLAVIPDIERFQRIGEGLGETLTRLVTEYVVVDTALERLGLTFGMVGVESLTARERLIELSGGLDDFQKKTSSFAKNFLTSGQVLTILERQVSADLATLGYTGIRTKEQFVALVQSLDLSTESGAAAFTGLMNVSDAFSQVADAAEKLADKRLDLEIRLLELSGKSAEALAMKRERELAALDESLRPLQLLIYAQEDLNQAQEDLTSVYDKASASLRQLKLLTTDSFKTLFDYTKYLHQAVRAGVPGAEAALPTSARNTFIPGKNTPDPNAAIVAEIEKLRAEQQAGQIAMAQYLRQTAEILRRWNGDGMPETRSVA